jgi:penicillin-binding protein 1A
LVALFAAATLAAAPALAAPELPRLPPIVREPQITYLDRNGAVIGMRGGRHAPPLDIARLPAHVPAAFVAIEDRRFYEHNGVDPRGIARAVMVGIDNGRLTQGASTITQQLARNLWLSPEQTLERKAKEAAYAVQLERAYTKKQILALYLSRVYFGSGAYGLEAASRRYFNKPAARLTVREAAMLAGVLKSPTNYNPAEATQACLDRSKLVLQAMVETGVLSEADRKKALASTPKVWKTSPTAPAQYFVDWVDPQARQIIGRLTQDITIETTLDLPMETAAADAARAAVPAAPGAQAAMVGGTSYGAAPYNRAVTARRQAGSAWKPFVYLAALEAGRTPDTPVIDEPVTIANWTPSNYDEGFLGPLTLERALAQSVNTVAARLADEVGRPTVALTARRLGIASPVNTDPAMALGTTLVSPLEMTQAYAVFANGGNRVQPYGIERIRIGGRVVYQRAPVTWTPIVANPALGDLNRMLRSVVTSGTGTRAAIPGYDIAGKTGTTSDYKDAWFCGYTGGFAACAWMGRDDAKPLGRITGGGAPAQMWRTFMATAVKRVPAQPIPAGPPPPQPLATEPAVVAAAHQEPVAEPPTN